MEIITLDCKDIKTAERLHQELAQALHFPDYYGKNLDALFDCLTEYR